MSASQVGCQTVSFHKRIRFIFTSWGMKMFFIIKLSEDIEIHLIYINNMNWITVRSCRVMLSETLHLSAWRWIRTQLLLMQRSSGSTGQSREGPNSKSRSMLVDSVLSSTEAAAIKLQKRRSKLWRSQWGPQPWIPAADGRALWGWSCGWRQQE